MAKNFDVGREAKEEDRIFCVAGIYLPLSQLFTPTSAARALTLRPHPGDVILSSYPRCDSRLVDTMVWGLLYPDLTRPPLDGSTGRFLPCQEMTTASDLTAVREHARRNGLPKLYKTYLPFRLVPFCRQTRYIYVVRCPWDACAAHYRFLSSIGCMPETFDQFFEDFLDGDVPYGSYFRHVAPWNRRVGEGNVMVLSREQVDHNPRSALFKIAAFLGERYLEMLMDNEKLERDILSDVTELERPKASFSRLKDVPDVGQRPRLLLDDDRLERDILRDVTDQRPGASRLKDFPNFERPGALGDILEDVPDFEHAGDSMDTNSPERDILRDVDQTPGAFLSGNGVLRRCSFDYLEDDDEKGCGGSRGPTCSEKQLNLMIKKVSQHFGNTSIEFLWLNLFQKQLLVR